MKKVVVGMSGGVDSSVSALLLKQQGYEVIGMFMKNWEEKDENGVCRSARDYEDVVKVCKQLDIPFYSVNFTEEYRNQVFSHFLAELEAGFTPNPDILCNREIKFKAFLEKAISLGADFLATGHYCRIHRGIQNLANGNVGASDLQQAKPLEKQRMCKHILDASSCKDEDADEASGQLLNHDVYKSESCELLKGSDPNKDQSYFLYTLPSTALQKVLFPIGGMLKTEVRKIAKEFGLATSEKKDSTGICFIGKRNFKEFTGRYLGYKPGNFENLKGQVIGQHDGIAFYTIGQRKGLCIGGPGEAWFVIGKDIARNVVIIEQGKDHPSLYQSSLIASDLSWVAGRPPSSLPFACWAKVRYRQPEQPCTIEKIEEGKAYISFQQPQRAITPRQSIVFYIGDCCLGGGIIQ